VLNWISVKEFTVTEDHIKLLKRAMVSWDSKKHGAPAIDIMQPYGTTCIECNISQILGIKPKLDLGTKRTYFSDEQKEYMEKTHRETQIALSIFLKTGKMEPGAYKHSGYYNWTRVDKEEKVGHHPV